MFPTPQEAIDWAMQSKNTSRSGDIPGGLGLNLLKEFIVKNDGRLLVCSNGGYWEFTGGQIIKTAMRGIFPGTAVAMERGISGKESYRSPKE